MNKIFSVLIIFFICNIRINAQELDLGFGLEGKVITDINPNANIEGINAILSLENQKIIVGGSDNSNAFLVRYNNDGSLDQSFQNNGFLQLPINSIVALAKLSENEIYFTGSITEFGGGSSFVIGKIDSNGNLDANFGINGIKTLEIGINTDDISKAMTIQDDGKIIIVGSTTFGANSLTQAFIVRVLPDGNYDTTFNTDGIFTIEMVDHRQVLLAVTVTNDGKIVSSGQVLLDTGSNQNRMCVLRLLTNGNLDTSFATVGYKFFNPTAIGGSTAQSNVTLSDGSIILGGYSYVPENPGVINNFTLVKFDTNGNFDANFGNNGVVVSVVQTRFSKIYQIKLDSNLDIYAVGHSYIVGQSNVDFTLSKYNSNGALMTDFGTNGFVYMDFNGFADFSSCFLIENNKILLAGTTTTSSNPTNQQFAMVRFTIQSELNANSSFIVQNDIVVYPTLFSNQLNVVSKTAANADISLYDFSGRLLFKTQYKINQNTLQLDLSFIAKGNYFLKFKNLSDLKEVVFKVIKQ